MALAFPPVVLPHGRPPLVVKLIAGHGAWMGRSSLGRDPDAAGLEDGLPDGRVAGRVPGGLGRPRRLGE